MSFLRGRAKRQVSHQRVVGLDGQSGTTIMAIAGSMKTLLHLMSASHHGAFGLKRFGGVFFTTGVLPITWPCALACFT